MTMIRSLHLLVPSIHSTLSCSIYLSTYATIPCIDALVASAHRPKRYIRPVHACVLVSLTRTAEHVLESLWTFIPDGNALKLLALETRHNHLVQPVRPSSSNAFSDDSFGSARESVFEGRFGSDVEASTASSSS